MSCGMASVSQICYSEKYHDDKYEYRHVILPSKLAALPPSEHLMTETEWRNLGVQQSPAWVHYMIHSPGKRFQRWKRARTTSLNAFVAKDLQEAILSRQSRGRLSPTRCSDPQPIGLVFQKPLQPNGGQPYAIWNPEPGKRKTQSRFPQLVSHIDLTNFSCGKTKSECPWESKVQPPQVEYSLKSTTRSSYQHPLSYPEWIRPTKPSKKGISEEYAAQGIVPSLLPQINNTKKNEFLENLKLAGMSGLRALGECSAKTLEKPIVQQLVEK